MVKYIRIMRENKKITKQHYYKNPQGIKVGLENYFKHLNANTKVYKTIQLPSNIARQEVYDIKQHIYAQKTIECALMLRKNGTKGNIIALNFANGMYPGGGYIVGGDAQEESLCRASVLYASLKADSTMYRHNRLHILPTYTDYMIYSHGVPIIRDDNGVLLEHYQVCSFISAPAVNRTFARYMFSSSKMDQIMQNRIDKVIALGLSHEPEVIILGAFGCGAFGNKKERVLDMFERSINRYVPERIKVIFAII